MKQKDDIPDQVPASDHKKRNLLIDAAVIGAVLLIIGVVWWIGQRPKPEPASKMPQYSREELAKTLNTYYGKNDYVGAVRLIEGQKTINTRPTQIMLAIAYANQGDFRKAIGIMERLERSEPLSEADAGTAGEIAERGERYDKAIIFYEKAKQRAAPEFADQAAIYEYRIQELRKK